MRIVWLGCLLLAVVGCSRVQRNDRLAQIEALLEQGNQPDSAFALLVNQPVDSLDTYNRAYHTVLVAQALFRQEKSLLECDTALDEAIEVLRENGDINSLVKALISKGQIWTDIKGYDEAMQTYDEAIKVLMEQKTLNKNLLSRVYDHIGLLYLSEERDRDALAMFYKSYKIDVQDKNAFAQTMSLLNIGETYFSLHQPDSAFLFMSRALEMAQHTHQVPVFEDMIRKKLSDYYIHTGQYQASLDILNQIHRMNEAALYDKGFDFMQLQQVDSAAIYFQRVTQSSNNYLRVKSYHYLSWLEETLGHYRKAYDYARRYETLIDTISNKARQAELQVVEYRNKKQAFLQQTRHETREKMQVILFGAFVVVLSSVLVSVLIHRKRKLLQRTQENKILKKEAEIADLQTKIEKTRHLITVLRHDRVANSQAVDEKESEINNLQNHIDKLQCEIFKMQPIYKQITHLNAHGGDKILPAKDRETLQDALKHVFAKFIAQLSAACPGLSDDELLHCCLSLLNLDAQTISLCFGYTDTNATRQRKARIKRKMGEAEQMRMYEFVFQN